MVEGEESKGNEVGYDTRLVCQSIWSNKEKEQGRRRVQYGR